MPIDTERRLFLRQSTASASTLAMVGCATATSPYEELAANVQRTLATDNATNAQTGTMAELVRYSTLAASGHNTQPWLYEMKRGNITILPDLTRRTPVVDPDDHHLYASLGCAAENLVLAARAQGYSDEVDFVPNGEGSLRVDLAPATAQGSDLFQAIPSRQVSRAEYDGNALAPEVLDRLVTAAGHYDVRPHLIIEPAQIESMLDLILAGNAQQIDDPTFVAELKAWIRFNPRAAAATRDGLFAGSSGNPNLPGWIAPMMFAMVFTKGRENDKLARHIRSSSGLLVLVADSDDRQGWINAGRAYERFALQATVEGLQHAFVNQAVEVLEMRRQLQTLLALGEQRPNLIVRFGHGPTMPRSLRRAVQSVVI